MDIEVARGNVYGGDLPYNPDVPFAYLNFLMGFPDGCLCKGSIGSLHLPPWQGDLPAVLVLLEHDQGEKPLPTLIVQEDIHGGKPRPFPHYLAIGQPGNSQRLVRQMRIRHQLQSFDSLEQMSHACLTIHSGSSWVAILALYRLNQKKSRFEPGLPQVTLVFSFRPHRKTVPAFPLVPWGPIGENGRASLGLSPR